MLSRWFPSLLAVAALLLLSGCLPPGSNNGNNGSADAASDVVEGDFVATLGKSNQGDYEEFSSSPTLEVVSGFQGGFHIEPALKIEELEAEEFFAVVTYHVEDVDSGEMLEQSPSMYRVDQSAFETSGDALLRNYERIILSVSTADDAAGRTVEVSVDVEIEGIGVVSTSRTVELVDEVDEFGG